MRNLKRFELRFESLNRSSFHTSFGSEKGTKRELKKSQVAEAAKIGGKDEWMMRK